MFFFGDVKTQSSRYPKAALEKAVGLLSGDWATMTTTLSDDSPAFAVGHRRGGAIHTYIFTSGSTRRGKDQAHSDDHGPDGYAGPPRKCPAALNDWTLAQPKVDKNNRWRQNILAIEERHRTTSFPFRLFTTITGIIMVNAYEWHLYFNNVSADDCAFDDFVEEVSWDGCANSWDEDHAATAPGARDGAATPKKGGNAPPSPSSRKEKKDAALCEHLVGPIKSVRGWVGAGQQRCAHCKAKPRTCCLLCSSSTSLVVLCMEGSSHGAKMKGPECLSTHASDPLASRRISASSSRSRAAKKRGWRQK